MQMLQTFNAFGIKYGCPPIKSEKTLKEKMVAKGEDIEMMLAQVRKKYPQETPFVAKIVDERLLVLLIKNWL